MAVLRTAPQAGRWPVRALLAVIVLSAPAQAAFGRQPQGTSALHLRFTGDIMMHVSQLNATRPERGTDYRFETFFEGVRPLLQDADFTVGNLETTLIERNYTGYPCFGSPECLGRALAWAGFDVLVTANNHTLDKLETGVRNTLDILDAYGLRHAGTARSPVEAAHLLVLERNSISLAVLAYTEMTNGIEQYFDKEKLAYMVNYAVQDRIVADIQRARAGGVDAVLVFLHWGDEYQRQPARRQVSLGDALIAAGADLVVGCHPHMTQPAVWRTVQDANGQQRRGLVAYSLGNFISSQRDRYKDAGAILDVRLEKGPGEQRARVVAGELVPTWIQICRSAGKTDYRVLSAQAVAVDWPLGLDPLVRKSEYERAVLAVTDLEQLLSGAGSDALRMAGSPAPYARPRFFAGGRGWFSCSEPFLEAAWDLAVSGKSARLGTGPVRADDRDGFGGALETHVSAHSSFLAQRGAAVPVKWNLRETMLRELFGVDAAGTEWSALSFVPRVPHSLEHATLTLPAREGSVTARYVRAKGFEVVLPRGSRFHTQNARTEVPVVVSWLPSGAVRPLTPDETVWLGRHGWRRAAGGDAAVWLSVDEQCVRVVQEGYVLWEALCSTSGAPGPSGWHVVKARTGAETPLDGLISRNARTGGAGPPASQDEEQAFTRLITLRGLSEEAFPCACTRDRITCDFHGADNETGLGTPAAKSGVRLSHADAWRLYDMVHAGMLVLATDYPELAASR